jgi:AAA ATPase-like protein
MTNEQLLILDEFVDRDAELDAFCEILSSTDKIIMVVSGDKGIGKTWLLARLMHVCVERRARTVEVARSGSANYDYLTIMRKIRDGVGEKYFNRFNDLVNYFTVASYNPKLIIEHQGSIAVAENMTMDNSSVRDVIGLNIQDLNYHAPRSDKEVPEAERKYRLTELFTACLTAALEVEPLMVFIDDVEEMLGETRQWLWLNLVKSVQKGRLSNIKFVLSIREDPLDAEFDRLLRKAASSKRLAPWGEVHVHEYLEKRGIPKEHCGTMAWSLMKACKGNPQAIASFVDACLQS